MPLISAAEFSPVNAPSDGVIPKPYVSSLGGETYKYESAYVGGKRKQKRRTRKAKKNRRSRKTRNNRK